jgi:DNA-binding Lrp family transcriptional regulator
VFIFYVTSNNIILGGCMALAFVMVNTVPDKSKLVLERIGEIEGVEEAYRVFGVYDIVAVVKAETIEELKKTVTHIRRLEHALTSLTLPVVS